MANMKEAKRLKQEVAKLKGEVERLKYQQTINEKFKETTEALNKILSLQISPMNQTGVGYDQELAIKGSSSITQEKVENVKC